MFYYRLSFLYYARYTLVSIYYFFFFNDTATTEIYTLSLHDALPISGPPADERPVDVDVVENREAEGVGTARGILGLIEKDRKSTRLNSSHLVISYAVFCLKKKKKHVSSIRTVRS